MVDDSATLKPDTVRRWLGARPRYHLHCTPSYSSWLDIVEIWFNIITQRAIRRGVFRIVKKLIAKIEDFVTNYDVKSGPFMWNATADSILDKLNLALNIAIGMVEEERAGLTLTPKQRTAILKILRELVHRDVRAIWRLRWRKERSRAR